MPILHVRDFPEDLYEKLFKSARQNNRSIAVETMVLLQAALNLDRDNRKRRRALLEKVKDLQIRTNTNLPNPATLLREDSNRGHIR